MGSDDHVKSVRLGVRHRPQTARVRPRTVIFLICAAAVLYTAHLALSRSAPSTAPQEEPEAGDAGKPARPAEKGELAATHGVSERPATQQPPQQRATDHEPGKAAKPAQGGAAAAGGAKPRPAAASGDTGKGTAVVVIAYNRPDYLTRALESILRPLPKSGFTVFISQDGNIASVADVAARFAPRGVQHMQHIDTSPIDYEKPSHEQFRGYYLIARHYKWALTQLFDVRDYDRVIILEDDIEVSSDFYEFFMATWPLLEKDPTLWAVSAFNDNGKPQHVRDAKQLYRSDFFPGLGWLMTRKLWRELGPIWPRGFWDDWMRRGDIRKGRVTIRPEVSRSYTFGQEGASHGEFFDTHLRPILLNKEHVPFTEMDVSYLLKGSFDGQWVAWVTGAKRARDIQELRAMPGGDVRLEYGEHQTSYAPLARSFGLMEDEKDGVPRTAYMGVVCFRDGPRRVFLTPRNWEQKFLAPSEQLGGGGGGGGGRRSHATV